MDFNYTPQWYADESVPWLPAIETADDLLYHYTDPTILPFIANNKRWEEAFENYPDLEGRLLELGFNSGLTVHRMAKKYPLLYVDGIDFNPALKKIVPFIKDFLPNIQDIWLGDTQMTGKPDDYYDFITSFDYFEHLPALVYAATLWESRRVLKSGGLMWVYFGKPDNPEHINRREDRSVIEDFKQMGFSLVDDGEVLVFRNEKKSHV